MLRKILTTATILGFAGTLAVAAGPAIAERQDGTQEYRERAVSQCIDAAPGRDAAQVDRSCSAVVEHETGTRSIFP